MKLLTIKEVAAILTVSTHTARRMIVDGRLEHVRIGGSIRVKSDTLDAFIDAYTSYKWEPVDGRGRSTKKVTVKRS